MGLWGLREFFSSSKYGTRDTIAKLPVSTWKLWLQTLPGNPREVRTMTRCLL